VTDIYDRATVIEEMQRQHAIDRQRAKTAGPQVGYSHCQDCGEPIDPARRQVVRQCRRCVACQGIAERLTR
jgi:phage/conjugal plasmid C-4 type zinc finger TraR family protein